MDKTVELKVNGQIVDLNGFVQEALAGVLQGYLSALDRIPEPVREIEVRVKIEAK